MGTPRSTPRKPSLRSPLPSGSLAVGLGVVVYGLTAYGFLIVGARTLGPERYAALAVFWAIVYLLGPGLFLPLEQEVARGVAARRSTGLGALPLVRRALLFGGAVVLVLVAAALAFRTTLVERLFDGEGLLVVGLVIGLSGYAVQHVVRGVLAGGRRFGSYGFVLGTEGVLRLIAAPTLAALGVAAAGPFGLAVGLAPLISILVGLRPSAGVIEPGPEAHWGELSRSLGYLLTSSLLAQYLAVAAPIVVKMLAPPNQGAVAGHLMASLVMVRVPLFLFQAVQPPLLARLSGLAGAGRVAEFLAVLRKLVGGLALAVAATLLGTFVLGPWAVSTFFGPEFALPRTDLLLLAGGTAALIVAMALAQALIALSLHARLALAWLLGAGAFTTAVALGSDLLPRVERAFVLGPVVAATTMAIDLVVWSRRAARPGEPEPEIVAPIPVEP
jgi:O-antigen/teichoic acid export membrane protein